MVLLLLGVADALSHAELSGRELADGVGVREAKLVHLLRHTGTGVLQRHRVAVLVHRAERLVDLHERAVRQTLNHTGLDTVLQDFTVGALQANAQAVGDEEGQRRQDDQANAAEPGHRVQRDLEEVRDVVVTTGDGQQQEEGQAHHADTGAHRDVARTLQQVVVGGVAGDLLLDERVRNQQHDHQATQQSNPERTRDGVVAKVELPRRHDTGGAVSPQHVDVRLGASGNLRRIVRTQVPDGVDRRQTSHAGKNSEDHHHVTNCLGCEYREDTYTDNVVLGASRPRELGVLLEPDEREVRCNEGEDDARQDQHVQDVETIQHEVRREVAAENRPVDPGADDGQTQDDCGHDAQANTGQQVVRQRVTHEALDHAEQHEGDTDKPVSLTRATERAGEEHAHHVGEHRHHEHQRGPVVHLADEQAASDIEREVQGRGVRARHFHTVQREVRAVVDDLCNRRVKEQCQVDTGQQQDDEAVQRHLTQHEGPVGGKDLVQLRAQHARDGVARINVVRGLLKFSAH